MWREFHERDVTVLSSPKRLPKWVDGRQGRGRKGHRRDSFNPINDIRAASVGGEHPDTVPTYRRNVKGRGRLMKDYSKPINNRIARLLERAMEGV
jgi:hypothetical protein